MLLQTHRNRHGNTDKQHINGKINFDHAMLMPKLIVQSHSNSSTESKRNGHTRYSDNEGGFPVAEQKPEIDFEANDEEEQGKSDICR